MSQHAASGTSLHSGLFLRELHPPGPVLQQTWHSWYFHLWACIWYEIDGSEERFESVPPGRQFALLLSRICGLPMMASAFQMLSPRRHQELYIRREEHEVRHLKKCGRQVEFAIAGRETRIRC